jgi:hypothetical protein
MMTADTTMILFLNSDQTTALYDLQVKILEAYNQSAKDRSATKELAEVLELYRRVMRPTYEPEKN